MQQEDGGAQWKACTEASSRLFSSSCYFPVAQVGFLHLTIRSSTCAHASLVQNVGKRHILFDKLAPKPRHSPPTEPRPREWSRLPCGQSLDNVIMNTVSLLSKQGIGQAASGVSCLHRCVCVFMHEPHLCVHALRFLCDFLAEDYNIKLKLQEGILSFVTLIISHLFILLEGLFSSSGAVHMQMKHTSSYFLHRDTNT